MKFSELRDTMQTFSGASVPEYQFAYIASEVKNLLNELNYQYVEYLTQDIINADHKYDLKNWLGSSFYMSSNDHAKECLEYCPIVKHLWGSRIKVWTDSALKCYDNFLLKYVQVDNHETISKSYSGLKETDVYNHLIHKGGVEKEIGQYFTYIYQLRSSFHHVQIQQTNGIRIPKRLTNKELNKKRNLIIQWFKLSLIALFSLVDDSIVKTDSKNNLP